MPTYNVVNIDHNGVTDTYVDSSSPKTNFNGGYNTFTGLGDGTAGPARTWLKLNFGGIPRNAKIITATLEMGAYVVGDGYNLITYEFQKCSDNSWGGSTITWNNAPNASMVGSPTTIFSATEPKGQIFQFDIKTDVQAAVAGDRLLTYRVKNVNEGADTSYMAMYTFEEYLDFSPPYPNINFSVTYTYDTSSFFQSFN